MMKKRLPKGAPNKRAPKGASGKPVPKGPTPPRRPPKSPERLIIADIQDAFDVIWKSRKKRHTKATGTEK